MKMKMKMKRKREKGREKEKEAKGKRKREFICGWAGNSSPRLNTLGESHEHQLV